MASPPDSSSCSSCSPPSPSRCSPSAVDKVKEERGKLSLPSSAFEEYTEKERIFPPIDKAEFNPDDQYLIGHYLYVKVKDKKPPYPDVIKDINPYEVDPDQLPLGGHEVPNYEGYYFTIIQPSASEGTHTIRATPNGHWKQITDSDVEILNSHEKRIGFRRSLVFYQGNGPNAMERQWFMREYRLNSELFKDEDQDRIRERIEGGLLCKVRHGHSFDDHKTDQKDQRENELGE